VTGRSRLALGFAVLGAWIVYRLSQFVMRELDWQAWVRAWDAVPAANRTAIRDTLLAEEGITE